MRDVSLKIVKRSSQQRSALYATCADFCRIFAEDMKNLYMLSLALTADPVKAEQCFVSGLDDCTTNNQVFIEWAGSWARRVVIKNAIRMIAPEAERASRRPGSAMSAQRRIGDRPQAVPEEISAVLDLPPFERFVLVMTVFEGYPDQDCALLLGSTKESVLQARVKALERLAAGAVRAESLRDERGSVEEDRRVLATPA
jgi:hypothetical protein